MQRAGAIILKINHTVKIPRSIKVNRAAPENVRERLLKCMKSTAPIEREVYDRIYTQDDDVLLYRGRKEGKKSCFVRSVPIGAAPSAPIRHRIIRFDWKYRTNETRGETRPKDD